MARHSSRIYRVFDPSLYHEVTQRIRDGKFLLDPNDPQLKAAIYGQLAKSLARYKVTLLALHFLGVTLHCSGSLALTLSGRLFVEFAAAHFGQNTGLFAGALETTQSYVEGFVLFNFDGWHPGRTFTVLPNGRRYPARAREYVDFKGRGY